MDERNQIGVLTQFILARVFPETSPIEFGEHVVHHPDTHPPRRFSDVALGGLATGVPGVLNPLGFGFGSFPKELPQWAPARPAGHP